MNIPVKTSAPTHFGCLASLPRENLVSQATPLEELANLQQEIGGARLFVKRDDCTGLAFGGNKARQLEFYFGEAVARGADTILITGAVQSNFVRMAAAAARKLGMECHVQHEARVATDDALYHSSGNVLLTKLMGATLHTFPVGDDEAGADRQLQAIADDLREAGRRPYVIPLGPGHPPLGALGYVLAAQEIVEQIRTEELPVGEIVVASGSGATHAGLLFGLRALGSDIRVTGVCVRRDAEKQRPRILETCNRIGKLLKLNSPVDDGDICLSDEFLAPGYGVPNAATLQAIVSGAQSEGLMLDPTYTGKAFAGFLQRAATVEEGVLFVHTGGTPAMFAYQSVIEAAL